MKLLHALFRRARTFRRLQRHLRSSPGHFRGLILSAPKNAVRLALLRTYARLTGRRLTVIALTERLGDIVACEPVIRHLRCRYPHDLIVWAGRPVYLELFRDHPELDGTIPLHCVTEWSWLSQLPVFDRAVDLHINRRFCSVCGPEHALIKTRGDTRITFDNYFHHGTLLEAFSQSAGLSLGRDEQPTLFLPPELRNTVDRFALPSRFVAIHAQTEDAAVGLKSWNVSSWNRLIDFLNAEHGLPVVEIGLHSELDRPDVPGYLNLSGRCSLQESAEVIRRACLFIGIDSGPAHVANAVGAPGLILLGHYCNFHRYLPYTGRYADPAHARIIQHDGPSSEIPLESCLSMVNELLGLPAERTGPAMLVAANEIPQVISRQQT